MQPICSKDRSHSSVIECGFGTIAIRDLHNTYTPPYHSWILSFLLILDILTVDSSYFNIQLGATAFTIPTCTVVDVKQETYLPNCAENPYANLLDTKDTTIDFLSLLKFRRLDQGNTDRSDH